MMSKPSLDVIGDMDVLMETPVCWYSDEPVRLDVIGGNTRVEYLGPGSSVGLLCDDAVIAHADGVTIEQMRGFSRIELLEQSHIGLVTDAATIGTLDSTSDVGTLTGYARVLYCAGGVGTLSGDAVIHSSPPTRCSTSLEAVVRRYSTSPEAVVQRWLSYNAVPVVDGSVDLFAFLPEGSSGGVLAPEQVRELSGGRGVLPAWGSAAMAWRGKDTEPDSAGHQECWRVRVRVEDLAAGEPEHAISFRTGFLAEADPRGSGRYR